MRSLVRHLRRAAAAAALLLAGAAVSARAQGESYRVVVNAANPVTTLTKEQLAKLFMKKQGAWPAGDAVLPVDLGEDSPVRASFSKQVLKKDVGAMKGYWQQLIFTGRGVPPVEKASEAEVLAFVAGNKAAVGYISSGTAVGAGVKVLTVTN